MKWLTKRSLAQNLPFILIIAGVIGIICSLVLTLDKMAVLQNPDYQPSCNINPILSCGSVIRTKQASAFQIPNPFLGLVGFTVVVTTGVCLLAGARLKRWYWRGLQAGALFGVAFCLWLAYQSLYRIGALCIYCMVVWAITWAIFWYTMLYNLREKHLPTPNRLKQVIKFAQKHHLDIFLAWFVILIIIILIRFWYYWSTLL